MAQLLVSGDARREIDVRVFQGSMELRDQLRVSGEVLKGTEARVTDELKKVREDGLAALAEVRGKLSQMERDMQDFKAGAEDLRVISEEDVMSVVKELLGDQGVRLETVVKEQQLLSEVVNRVQEGMDKHHEKNKLRYAKDREDKEALVLRLEVL